MLPNVLKKYEITDEKVQVLLRTNERLAKLLTYVGYCELSLEKDEFKCLVKYIVGQQISDKARDTIWGRWHLEGVPVTFEYFLSKEVNELTNLGISKRKITAVKTLASEVESKSINLVDLQNLSNKEVMNQLTQIKGIGPWTVEMFLIFSLGRENVLSKGDGTIKRALKWLFELQDLPNADQVQKYFNQWSGLETVVSAYFWKASELKLFAKPFPNDSSIWEEIL